MSLPNTPLAAVGKHRSFVENGRSRPSRYLLAQRLDLPTAERNRLLLAGGFAPADLEAPYDGDLMRPLRESLRRPPATRR